MAEIIWSEPALEDLNALAEYIALDKPEPAASLVRRVFARVELLGSQPELGPRIPELRPNSRYRQLVEPPCRIFYRHDKKAGKLYILGVMRGERLFQKRLIRTRDKASSKAWSR
jgi:plasmid stabilization system protein ParE